MPSIFLAIDISLVFPVHRSLLTLTANISTAFTVLSRRPSFCIQRKMKVLCASNVKGCMRIVGLEWYNGLHTHRGSPFPSLALCCEDGRCQIMRSETDDSEPYIYIYLSHLSAFP